MAEWWGEAPKQRFGFREAGWRSRTELRARPKRGRAVGL
jgi:hypothetical protein